MSDLSLFTIPIHAKNREIILKQILELANQKDRSTTYVSTINVNFLRTTFGAFPWSSPYSQVLHSLKDATLSTVDGTPIVWLCRFLGACEVEKFSGSDIIPMLVKEVKHTTLSIFLLGGEEELCAAAAARIQEQNPNLNIVGTATPQISLNNDSDALIQEINESGAQLLLLNLGHPKQELWYQKVKHQLKVPVTIGIGGSLNFIAGTKKRAPHWMQQFGLEWFHRLLQEPGRLGKRYVLDLMHILFQWVPLLAMHTILKIVSTLIPSKYSFEFNPKNTIQFPTSFTKEHIQDWNDALQHMELGQRVTLDFKHCQFIDLWGVSYLVDFLKAHPDTECVNISKPLQLLLFFHKVFV